MRVWEIKYENKIKYFKCLKNVKINIKKGFQKMPGKKTKIHSALGLILGKSSKTNKLILYDI